MVIALSSLVQAAGDKEAGKSLALVCGACHGQSGNSTITNYPKLAGQNVKYLLKQMQDIKAGLRPVALMTGLLNKLSEQDLLDLATFYAAQSTEIGAAKAELLALGEKIYRSGIAELGIAACTACHSPTGKGNSAAGFPALSGQHSEYVALQLKAFRSEDRSNDGETRTMRDVAARLNDKEIEAIAS